jgi:hypothetical protein
MESWANLAHKDPCEATERTAVKGLEELYYGPYDYFIDETIDIVGDQYIKKLQKRRTDYYERISK